MERSDALASHLEHFRLRVLQDALLEATSAYWLRRAIVFEKVGTRECDEIARACRNAASLALIQVEDVTGGELDQLDRHAAVPSRCCQPPSEVVQ